MGEDANCIFIAEEYMIKGENKILAYLKELKTHNSIFKKEEFIKEQERAGTALFLLRESLTIVRELKGW